MDDAADGDVEGMVVMTMVVTDSDNDGRQYLCWLHTAQLRHISPHRRGLAPVYSPP